MTEWHGTPGCPDPEILGMFNEGLLTGSGLEALQRHLAGCDACVEVVGIAAAMSRSGIATPAAPPVSRLSPFWFAAAAAAVIAIAGAGFWLVRRDSTTRGVGPLIAAAPVNYRVVEPRLAGFPWAAYKMTRGENNDPGYLKLTGAAGEVLERAQHDASPDAARAAGVANVLLRKPAKGIEALEKAAAESDDPATWSDLAAARYAAAIQTPRAAELPSGLAAADKAIALAPRMAEAHFNRALILTRMGLRDDAANAWREYLAIDGSSPWAQEAREHLATLQTPQRSFHDVLKTRDVASLVREFPQESRAWFETEQLGVWGESMNPRDLAAARDAGRALHEWRGESLLSNAVAAIDAAHDPRALAAAHKKYRLARLAYRDGNKQAVDGLADAAARFDAAGSPMGDVARFYLACVEFDENQRTEARTLLETLTAKITNRSALRAQVQAKLGLVYGYEGRWSEALRALRVALGDYDALGETVNAAYTRGVIADTYDLAGEREDAWTQRVVVLDVLTARQAYDRVIAILSDAGRAEERAGNPAVALALVGLEVAAARRTGQPLAIADAYRRKALLAAQSDDDNDALDDLREARAAAAKLGAGLRNRSEAECNAAEGVALRRRAPARSIALLSNALAYFRASDTAFSVPDALLERARSFRAARSKEEARRDLAEAIDRVEAQQPYAAAADRDGILGAASPLFAEAIDLDLERGDAATAFAYAEKAHTRALLQRVEAGAAPATAQAIRAALDPRAVLLEVVPLPHGVALFRVTRDEIRVICPDVDPAQLRASIETLRDGIERNAPVGDVQRLASDVHDMLIAPAALGDAESLIVVAGPALKGVPWAALFDRARHEFLVERYTIAVAPSAGVWLASRNRANAGGNRLLLVNGGNSAELGDLAAAEAEIAAVGRAYGAYTVLAGADASPSRVLAEAPRFDIVHFAGHARASADAPDPALLLGNAEWFASQIAHATLRGPRLAVLAACDTARGTTERPDALPSLARAFLSAGVPEVVGTLWPVDDRQAAALFTELHRRIAAGERTPAALRHAQLALLRGPIHTLRHPIAWASAEIIGGSR